MSELELTVDLGPLEYFQGVQFGLRVPIRVGPLRASIEVQGGFWGAGFRA